MVPTSPMEVQQQVLVCAKAALDKRGENLKILDLSGHSSFTDYFVLCSGSSDRQLQSMADSVKGEMLRSGGQLLSTEGYAEGRWILMDFGDVVVHLFLDALREYYNLEGLWSDAPTVQVPAEFYSASSAQLN